MAELLTDYLFIWKGIDQPKLHLGSPGICQYTTFYSFTYLPLLAWAIASCNLYHFTTEWPKDGQRRTVQIDALFEKKGLATISCPLGTYTLTNEH